MQWLWILSKLKKWYFTYSFSPTVGNLCKIALNSVNSWILHLILPSWQRGWEVRKKTNSSDLSRKKKVMVALHHSPENVSHVASGPLNDASCQIPKTSRFFMIFFLYTSLCKTIGQIPTPGTQHCQLTHRSCQLYSWSMSQSMIYYMLYYILHQYIGKQVSFSTTEYC